MVRHPDYAQQNSIDLRRGSFFAGDLFAGNLSVGSFANWLY
jgi:hypothetical protein